MTMWLLITVARAASLEGSLYSGGVVRFEPDHAFDVRQSAFWLAAEPESRSTAHDVLGVWSETMEPTAFVSWTDAVLMANARSRAEGFAPTYRVERIPGLGNVYRWDREADGYRLPTLSEWVFLEQTTDQLPDAWAWDSRGFEPSGIEYDPAGEDQAGHEGRYATASRRTVDGQVWLARTPTCVLKVQATWRGEREAQQEAVLLELDRAWTNLANCRGGCLARTDAWLRQVEASELGFDGRFESVQNCGKVALAPKRWRAHPDGLEVALRRLATAHPEQKLPPTDPPLVLVPGADFVIHQHEITRGTARQLFQDQPQMRIRWSRRPCLRCAADLPQPLHLEEARILANALSLQHGLEPYYGDVVYGISVDPLADGYRIPTVEQWKQAAGAVPSVSGLDAVAHLAPRERTAATNNFVAYPKRVCLKLRNKHGLCDVWGNMMEWAITDEGSSVLLGGAIIDGPIKVSKSPQVPTKLGHMISGVRFVRPSLCASEVLAVARTERASQYQERIEDITNRWGNRKRSVLECHDKQGVDCRTTLIKFGFDPWVTVAPIDVRVATRCGRKRESFPEHKWEFVRSLRAEKIELMNALP